MANYLFTLTISPVQSFIAQARKSQDLFAGSEILSQLMGKVLDEFKNDTVIFPQTKEAVSNKIVVKLENKTEDEIKKIGKALEEKINKDFINVIFKATCKFDSALENFFQVFWVAVVLDDNYQESYKQLERNLGAVKNLRTFSQNPQPSGKAKCVLCGERNQAKEDKEDNLCLICYTKRKCEINNVDKEKFPSLAKICLLDWLKGVNYDKLKKLNDFDEEWFLDEPKKAEVTQFIKDNNLDISKQKKHYALLHFDVDSLGKKLSSLDEDGQKDLSKKLGDFALKAKKIVDADTVGKTVYAGGDDFLGFLNLASLFVVMQKIKDAFGEAIASLPYELTFSSSILIAHYKTPLHKVLDYSRELLEESKKHFDDKNGLGIMVMSSNAVISKTICRYGDVALLQKMKKAEMAKNLHFKLAQIFDYLGEMNYDEFLTQRAMIEVEIKRLIERESGKLEKNKELKELYEEIIAFLYKQNIELSTNLYQFDFDNFIGFLKTLEQLRKVIP